MKEKRKGQKKRYRDTSEYAEDLGYPTCGYDLIYDGKNTPS